MEQAAADRRYAEIHERRPFHDGKFSRWSEKATVATPYHFQDGVTIFVTETDVNPDDAFLTAPNPFGDAAGGEPSPESGDD